MLRYDFKAFNKDTRNFQWNDRYLSIFGTVLVHSTCCSACMFMPQLSSNCPPPPYQKSQERGGWKNCWRVSLGIFSSWGVANVTTVTLNYILIIVLLFALNVGVSPCFHRSVLGPVYRMYTSCFHNTVVSSCYRLHTFCLHHASVNSCFSLNMWF